MYVLQWYIYFDLGFNDVVSQYQSFFLELFCICCLEILCVLIVLLCVLFDSHCAHLEVLYILQLGWCDREGAYT